MVVRSRGPCYDISDLVKDCSTPGKVVVRKKARQDAKCYGFETQQRIIDFVSNDVFEDLEHQNTDVLDHEPDKGTAFDAYVFRIGPKYVYFAFFKRPNGMWVIKSFHPPQVGEHASPLSHTPFRERLKDWKGQKK